MSDAADEKAKKAAKKEKLKAEAEKLGVSYEELKAQKKDKKKRKREADKLNDDTADNDREQEKKRMRSWSGDFDAEKKDDDAPATKRLRTRSMDKAEDNAKIVKAEKSQTTEEWRKLNNIVVQGHGKNANAKFADPFIEFDDAPFNPTLQKTLKAAGFERPTFIQSQVSLLVHEIDQHGWMICNCDSLIEYHTHTTRCLYTFQYHYRLGQLQSMAQT